MYVAANYIVYLVKKNTMYDEDGNDEEIWYISVLNIDTRSKLPITCKMEIFPLSVTLISNCIKRGLKSSIITLGAGSLVR